jgi:hypothetical protein
VDLRNDIKTVKIYARKLKIKNKRERENRDNTNKENSRVSRLHSAQKLKKKTGGVAKIPELILVEDVEQLQGEIFDLEARINHREAIIKIDR